MVDCFIMKKFSLVYCLITVILLTSCGAKDLDDSSINLAESEITSESIINNETISTTTVPKLVTSLTTEETQIEIGVGDTIQLTYSMFPEDLDAMYTNVLWSSTDDTIASVDDVGNVTGVENGICTIVATSENNSDVVLKFTVTVQGNVSVSQVVQGSTISVSTKEFTTTTKATTTTTTVTTQEVTTLTQEVTDLPVDTTSTEEVFSQSENIITNVDVQPTYINNVLIVNSNHPLPQSYAPSSDMVYGENGLIAEVQQSFDLMNTDAINDGIYLTINSGYVSYDEQNTRYQNALANYGSDYANHYVDQAGYSESQTGYSILLNSADQTFDTTAEAQWVAENCYKYGFIVRYPQGKESITGKGYRSYQIRYVGVDMATQIYTQGLCLEEYLGI